MQAESHVPIEVEIRNRLLAAKVRADLAAYGDYRAWISDLCPVRPTSGPRVAPVYRIAGGETDTDPEPASVDGSSPPPADPSAPTPSEGSGAPESQPHDDPTTPEPALEEPAYIVALREDIAWLKSQFGSSDARVKALEGRMEQAMKGRKAQRPAAPTTVRTRMTVQEPPAGQEVNPPPERARRTKRLKWGRKTA